MRILITGGRDYHDYEAVETAIIGSSAGYDPDEVVIIHGRARGADALADEVGRHYGFVIESYPAKWSEHGRAAGAIRNQVMVNTGADICLAFPDVNSRGTWDCVRRARSAGIPVVIEPLP